MPDGDESWKFENSAKVASRQELEGYLSRYGMIRSASGWHHKCYHRHQSDITVPSHRKSIVCSKTYGGTGGGQIAGQWPSFELSHRSYQEIFLIHSSQKSNNRKIQSSETGSSYVVPYHLAPRIKTGSDSQTSEETIPYYHPIDA